MKRLTLFLLLIWALPASAADPLKSWNSSEIQLGLRKLANTGTVLYIAAHPDDENTALLSWLESERLVRAGYLALTRGDGGQNILGTEKGPLLGAIRTQELLAARRIDGAEQFFTRAVDYGFSKSPEEAQRIWDKEAVLADVVFVIRSFRPDVIITRFPTTGEGGHGQHTFSAIVAREAFRAAADPSRFPEQLSRVQTWQAKRLFWNAFPQALEQMKIDPASIVQTDLGVYNPLLGHSHTEIAGISRSMHRSQGDGTPQRRGSIVNYFQLLDGDPASKRRPIAAPSICRARRPPIALSRSPRALGAGSGAGSIPPRSSRLPSARGPACP
jgi:LmbE family N-acetylglucosaminyl deacetylase